MAGSPLHCRRFPHFTTEHNHLDSVWPTITSPGQIQMNGSLRFDTHSRHITNSHDEKSETNQKHGSPRTQPLPCSALPTYLLKKMKKNHDCCFIRWNSAGLGDSQWSTIPTDRMRIRKDEDQDHRPPAGQPRLSQSAHSQLCPHPNTLSIASKYSLGGPEPRNAFHTVRGLECGDERQKNPPETYRQKQFSQSAAPDRILTGECFFLNNGLWLWCCF